MSSMIQKPRPWVAATRSSSLIITSRTELGAMFSAERLPVVAIIERNVDGAFGAGEEQSATHGIFADDVDVFIFRNAVDDLCPGLAAIVRAQNVRTQIIQPQAC